MLSITKNPLTGLRAALLALILSAGAFNTLQAAKHYAPVNPDATPEARALLERLYTSVDEGKIISGLHHNQLYGYGYTRDLKRIADACGKEPLIWGGDLAWSADRVVELATDEYRKGHIITLMWHAARPMDKGPVNFSQQTQGDFTDAQWAELVTPGTEMNNAWLAQVDSISQYLKILQDRGIPVIWRPFHEMNGEWFWWGWRLGENGFPVLYRMMYDRMVNHNHLNNLLWVWNANAPRMIRRDTALDYELFYPGNDCVDILATDVYNRDWKGSHHDDLYKLGKGKLIALGELGSLPEPEYLKKHDKFAWFMIWTGFTEDRYNTLDAIKAIFDMPQTVSYGDECIIKVSPGQAIRNNGSVWQGWGTSLCWWANRIGYNQTLTDLAAR